MQGVQSRSTYLLWFAVMHTWSADGTGQPLTQLLREAFARQAGGLLLAMPHHAQSMQSNGTQLATPRLYEVDGITWRDGPVAN